MISYGYIKQATLAHMDCSEDEAQAMNLFSRFYIFANEAMQAICSGKPKYDYFTVEVVSEYAPLVQDGAIIRLATKDEIRLKDDNPDALSVIFLTDEEVINYNHSNNIYKVCDIISPTGYFISFANKQCYKYFYKIEHIEQIIRSSRFYERESAGKISTRSLAIVGNDFSYIGANKLKFYKPGTYMIPCKYFWYKFTSNLADEEEIDMPEDIALTIPLYVASICLQIDNPQKSAMKRSEFEMALARCTNTDFMSNNKIIGSW